MRVHLQWCLCLCLPKGETLLYSTQTLWWIEIDLASTAHIRGGQEGGEDQASVATSPPSDIRRYSTCVMHALVAEFHCDYMCVCPSARRGRGRVRIPTAREYLTRCVVCGPRV